MSPALLSKRCPFSSWRGKLTSARPAALVRASFHIECVFLSVCSALGFATSCGTSRTTSHVQDELPLPSGPLRFCNPTQEFLHSIRSDLRACGSTHRLLLAMAVHSLARGSTSVPFSRTFADGLRQDFLHMSYCIACCLCGHATLCSRTPACQRADCLFACVRDCCTAFLYETVISRWLCAGSVGLIESVRSFHNRTLSPGPATDDPVWLNTEYRGLELARCACLYYTDQQDPQEIHLAESCTFT